MISQSFVAEFSDSVYVPWRHVMRVFTWIRQKLNCRLHQHGATVRVTVFVQVFIYSRQLSTLA